MTRIAPIRAQAHCNIAYALDMHPKSEKPAVHGRLIDAPIIAHHDPHSVALLYTHLHQTASERLNVQIEFREVPSQTIWSVSLSSILRRTGTTMCLRSLLAGNQRVLARVFLKKDLLKIRWECVQREWRRGRSFDVRRREQVTRCSSSYHHHGTTSAQTRERPGQRAMK